MALSRLLVTLWRWLVVTKEGIRDNVAPRSHVRRCAGRRRWLSHHPHVVRDQRAATRSS